MDRIDRAILKALQADGRITTLELAAKVNLSPTATADRVKRLTREGYIEGYHASSSRSSSTARRRTCSTTSPPRSGAPRR